MKNLIYVMLTALLTGSDLYCKSYVEKNLKKGDEEDLCRGKIALRRVHNRGFAFNVAEKHPHLIRIVSAVVCSILGVTSVYTWLKDNCVWRKVGMALTLSGAISNTYDRLKRKYVVDYFGFQTKNSFWSKITYNLGDVFLFLGALMIVLIELLNNKS